MTDIKSPVAFFIADLHGGGAEKITVQVANALAQRGYSVDLICQSYEGPYVGNVSSRVRVTAVGSRSPFRGVLFLYRYLKRTRPSALFTVLEKPSLLGIVAAMLGCYRNVVPCIHMDFDSYASIDHKTRRKFLRLLVAVFYRYAAKIIVVSSGAGASMRRLLGSSVPIEVVYNGFDLDELHRQAGESIDLPFSADKKIPVFIGCGRMVPQKGFDILIHAFARLRKDIPARLIILGDGPLKEELVTMAQKLGVAGDAYFPGFVPSPAAWFARSDLFVLSSHTEGFGNVLVEALAAGLKVVSTNCPSGPVEVLRNGAYGKLVPVDDVGALAEAMKAALTETREREGGIDPVEAYIENNYSMRNMVDGYARIVESLR